jgi:hypothetical protein
LRPAAAAAMALWSIGQSKAMHAWWVLREANMMTIQSRTYEMTSRFERSCMVVVVVVVYV